jgi:hypothetical protein
MGRISWNSLQGEKTMIRKTQKKSLWQRRALSALACLIIGALLLSACNGISSGNTPGTPSSSTGTATTSTSSLSQSLQSQGSTELQAFQQWIALVQQNGGDITTYQQQYNTDQQALTDASTDAAYTTALTTLQGQVLAIKIPALKQEVTFLQKQLQQDVSDWGSKHTYQDSYNGKTYTQDYEYDDNTGIGGPLWLGEDLTSDQTIADWQQTIENLNMWIYNFQDFKTNFDDKTPWNQSHKTDIDLMQHYGFMNERVVVVSFSQQSLRAYDNGKLVNSFQIVTGQPDLPSPPGNWWIEGKKHPTVFKSSAPKGSPDWYPDTKINYAMQYHSNGYFFHDAWWRTQFGQGANYPHQDPDGDPFAGQGSHGCVNMSTSDSAWLYNFVSVYTQIVMY